MGVVTSESASICTVSVPSGATAKANGDECGRTGTCGSVTITTRLAVGSGAKPSASDVTSTASGSSAGGMVVVGSRFENTGTFTARTVTTIAIMAASSGVGENSSALACTATVCASCGATCRANGSVCAHTGTCGGATTTTSKRNGVGVDSSVLATTCTASACCVAGLVPSGL